MEPALGEFVERGTGAGGDDRETAAAGREYGAAGRRHRRRGIAILAEVGEENLAPAGLRDGFKQLARGGIGEMTVPPTDPLFGAPGAFRVSLEHLRTMVSFDHQHIRCPDAFPHVYWGMAQIGEPSQTAARREQIIFSVRDQKSHRLLCIVRHGEAANLQIAKLKGAPGFEKLPGHPMLEPFLGCGRRALRLVRWQHAAHEERHAVD